MTGYLAVSERDRAKIAEAALLIVLVGGFDGSGNFGDIIQTLAAASRFGESNPVISVVVESTYADEFEWMRCLPDDLVVLRFSEEPTRDIIEELPLMTGIYLTGGGYVNADWGPRKLLHVETVQALIGVDEPQFGRIMATGLQVSDHAELWKWTALLNDSRPLTCRDDQSVDVLRAAGIHQPAQNLGDDSFRYLRDLPIVFEDGPAVNVHINVSAYGAPDASHRESWFADELVALIRAIPTMKIIFLVAYDDARVNERAVVDRLVNSCQSQLVLEGDPELHYEVVSLPRIVADQTTLKLGSFGTISCSYHVGLLSLINGLPTLLVAENEYYDQKMTGLVGSFGLSRDAVVSTLESVHLLDRLELVGSQRLAMIGLSLRVVDASAAAADSAIREAVAVFERDAGWAQMQDLYPAYRAAVSEHAELKNRLRQFEVLVEAERQKNRIDFDHLRREVAFLRQRLSNVLDSVDEL